MGRSLQTGLTSELEAGKGSLLAGCPAITLHVGEDGPTLPWSHSLTLLPRSMITTSLWATQDLRAKPVGEGALSPSHSPSSRPSCFSPLIPPWATSLPSITEHDSLGLLLPALLGKPLSSPE